MTCKHKFKIYELCLMPVSSSEPNVLEERAIVVCEKCGLVKIAKIEN